MELTGLEFVASAVLAGLATLPGCKLGLWRAQPGMVAAAACDQDLLAGGSSLHVPAKAIAKLVSTDFVGLPDPIGKWSWGDSNPRPFGCQPNALPTELQPPGHIPTPSLDQRAVHSGPARA